MKMQDKIYLNMIPILILINFSYFVQYIPIYEILSLGVESTFPYFDPMPINTFANLIKPSPAIVKKGRMSLTINYIHVFVKFSLSSRDICTILFKLFLHAYCK